MSSNLYYNPHFESQLDKRNALPTYEEATGQVQPNTTAAVASSTVINNLNEHLPLNSNSRPTYQSHSLVLSDLSSRPRYEERSLRQSTTIRPSDSFACQMTRTDSEERERAITKVQTKKTTECIVLTIVIFLGILLIVIKMSHSTLNSKDSTKWTSQPHGHHYWS